MVCNILVFALLIGIISAIRQYSLLDTVLTGFSFIAFSMPIFLLAILLLSRMS